MKKVLFFTEPWWAFGAVHYGLSRALTKYGISSNVIDWRNNYSESERKFISSSYDLFVTTQPGIITLNQGYNISLDRIICVSHAAWDIKIVNHLLNNDIYNNLFGYSVVSDHLIADSINNGVFRIPSVTKIGIDFDLFYRKLPSRLSTIGYSGALVANNVEKKEIKRSICFLKSVVPSGLSFRFAKRYHFANMPGFYESVDAIMVTSSEEGAGLPGMEAAAAGRLVISTPVGYFGQNYHMGAGLVLPIDSDSLIAKASEYVNYYKQNDREFIELCNMCQSFARDNYDWGKVIHPWLELILK
jgi:glycosyltransferase involved in cell wall biosynthesis